MAGYTHVCDGCGAEVAVHERYVGRTLRCSSCGTAFLADPVLAEAVRRARDDARSRLRRRAARRWWIGSAVVVGAVVLGVGLWWLGQPGLGDGTLRPQLFFGQIVEIEGPGLRLAAIDHGTIGVLVEAAEIDDPAVRKTLADRPDVIEMTAGTRLKVVEVHKRDDAVVVRVLDGTWAGRKVWIPIEWIE